MPHATVSGLLACLHICAGSFFLDLEESLPYMLAILPAPLTYGKMPKRPEPSSKDGCASAERSGGVLRMIRVLPYICDSRSLALRFSAEHARAPTLNWTTEVCGLWNNKSLLLNSAQPRCLPPISNRPAPARHRKVETAHCRVLGMALLPVWIVLVCSRF